MVEWRGEGKLLDLQHVSPSCFAPVGTLAGEATRLVLHAQFAALCSTLGLLKVNGQTEPNPQTEPKDLVFSKLVLMRYGFLR